MCYSQPLKGALYIYILVIKNNTKNNVKKNIKNNIKIKRKAIQVKVKLQGIIRSIDKQQ